MSNPAMMYTVFSQRTSRTDSFALPGEIMDLLRWLEEDRTATPLNPYHAAAVRAFLLSQMNGTANT